MVTHHMHCEVRVHGAVAFTALPQVNNTISCTCLHQAGDGWRRGQGGKGEGAECEERGRDRGEAGIRQVPAIHELPKQHSKVV